jgi:hypothetical protein
MQITIDVITTRKEIFKALVESEENQSIIGITSKDLGEGMFMTSVKEILNDDDDVLIVLNSYDITGYFLEKNRVFLKNITGVIPFKAVFTNPFLKELQLKADRQAQAEEKKPDYIF